VEVAPDESIVAYWTVTAFNAAFAGAYAADGRPTK